MEPTYHASCELALLAKAIADRLVTPPEEEVTAYSIAINSVTIMRRPRGSPDQYLHTYASTEDVACVIANVLRRHSAVSVLRECENAPASPMPRQVARDRDIEASDLRKTIRLQQETISWLQDLIQTWIVDRKS